MLNVNTHSVTLFLKISIKEDEQWKLEPHISKPRTKWPLIEIIGPGTTLEVSVLCFTFNNFFNLNNNYLDISLII